MKKNKAQPPVKFPSLALILSWGQDPNTLELGSEGRPRFVKLETRRGLFGTVIEIWMYRTARYIDVSQKFYCRRVVEPGGHEWWEPYNIERDAYQPAEEKR